MQPKLSVCLITYNHEKFIKQAFDGILMQQADFDWEVVVGDDCSKDGTTAIVEEYARKYPDRIRLTGYKNNAGMTMNWLRTIDACKGEYIALLEGDDYWTDPKKLQTQVELLDGAKSLSFVCHDVKTIFEPGMPTIDYLSHPGESRQYTINEFLSWQDNFFVPTGSIVFRRSMLGTYPEWANKDLKVCIDAVTEMMLASSGPFYYLNQVMGRYRIHSGGVSQVSWLGKENLFEFDVVYILKKFNPFTNHKYNTEIVERLQWLYMKLLKKNDPHSAAYREALFGLVKLNPKKHINLLKGWIINNYIPPVLYKLYRRVF